MSSVPYIGAKISLTSRSQIRYEGTLAKVNPQEYTISLEQVKMMGTEGRRPEGEIAPNNQTYDLVVFKSADISDLKIFEAAPAAVKEEEKVEPVFVDPAIQSVNGSGGNKVNAIKFGSAPVKEDKDVRKPMFGSPSSSRVPMPRTAPTFGSLPSERPQRGYEKIQVPQKSTNPLQAHSPPATLAKAYTSLSNSAPISTAAANSPAAGTDKIKAYNTGTGKIELVEKETRSYAAVLSDGAGRFKLSKETSVREVPKREYDFQSANARLLREEEGGSSVSVGYDRGSSFFDTISCDATTHNERIVSNERQKNIETFGVAGSSSNTASGPYYGRGGRGGGGRYSYNRGGGYGQSSRRQDY